jgi:hypothetical protein
VQPSSTAFGPALKKSHTLATLATVHPFNSNQILATLQVTDGSVTTDATRFPRSTCDITLVDASGGIIPNEVTDLLHPNANNEIQLWRGIKYPSGSVELISLGFFHSIPTTTDGSDSTGISTSGVSVEIQGSDRSQLIAKINWLAPYSVPTGQTLDAAVQAIINSRIANLGYNLSPSSYVTPSGFVFGLDGSSNPFADATTLVTADSKELLIDAQGIVVSRAIPTTANPVASVYSEGSTATLLELVRTFDDSSATNAVVVTSSTTNTAGTATLQSVAYVNGVVPIYVFPSYYSSDLITTQAQSDSVAAAQALLLTGTLEEVSFSAVPDPRLNVGDVVQIIRAASKINRLYVVQSVTIPMQAGETMEVTCVPRGVPQS